MTPGHHEHVPGRDRLDVHEDNCTFGLTHETCLGIAGDDLAEDTVPGLVHYAILGRRPWARSVVRAGVRDRHLGIGGGAAPVVRSRLAVDVSERAECLTGAARS